MLSKIARRVQVLLKEAFPFSQIVDEFYINYRGVRLFLDFYVPDYKIGIEVHGQQHDEFIPHFHSSARGWALHKRRDNLKLAWAEEEGVALVVIREKNLPKTFQELLYLIEETA